MKKMEEMQEQGYSDDEILLEIAGIVGPKILEQDIEKKQFIEDNFNMAIPEDNEEQK